MDVPGLGFASTNNSNPDGWKNVIDRYISVRENLKLVFHLVDSKVGITAVDEQVWLIYLYYNLDDNNIFIKSSNFIYL